VQLELDNLARLRTGVLLVEDELPHQLGPPARFVVPGMGAGGSVQLAYDITAGGRGRYRVGPAAVRVSDPFGLVEVRTRLAGQHEVVVHPRIEPLSAPWLGADLRSSVSAQRRRLHAEGEEFFTTREYRDGDDLRKVHWRSSARQAKLMIRQEETPWQARALVALDARRSAHRGAGETGSLERTISAAASMALRLARGGYELALLGDDGRLVEPGATGDPTGPVLDYLACVEPSGLRSLGPMAGQLARRAGEGLLLAVITVPNAEDAAALARCGRCFSRALAVLVRTETWTALNPRELALADGQAAGTVALLERAGWRTATLARGERLEETWQRLMTPLGRASPALLRRSR